MDDNVETVLHNLMRGTGPRGIAGMPLSRPLGRDPIGQDLILIRPLLKVQRSMIRAGLQSIDQAWREDSSNENTAYRRNWIRHELLPLMESQFPAVVDAVARARGVTGEWTSTIDTFADRWLQEHVSLGTSMRIRRDDATPPAIVIAALQIAWAQLDWPLGEMTHDHWKRLASTIAGGDDHRYSLPAEIDVRACGRHVELGREP